MAAQLPVDIVQLVHDELFAWEDDSLWHIYGVLGRRAWLAQVLTVSRAWYSAVLPLLYRTIEISPKDEVTLDLLLRTLHRRPDFAALVRTLRPYERQYHGRQTDSSFRDGFFRDWKGFQITKSMFEDRDLRLEQRRIRKIIALIKTCINLDELGIQSFDVDNVVLALKHVVHRVPRLVIESAHRLDWNMTTLDLASDWSNLQSLKLDGSARFEPGTDPRRYNVGARNIALFTKMTNLTDLQILGWVHPQRMCDILHAVRNTLRSLTCYQLRPCMSEYAWLAPVNSRLRKLSLFVQYAELMCDLSSMTAIKDLHVFIMNTAFERTGSKIESIFPEGVERVEWTFLDSTGTPAAAEERVYGLFAASDRGAMRNLRTAVVNINIRFVGQEVYWSTFTPKFQLQCARRGFDCWVAFNQDCSQFRPDDPRDIFALAVHERFLQRQQMRQVHDAEGRDGSASAVQRVSRMALKAWTRCCCVAWMCCCCCPSFRCPHWFV